MLRRTMQIPIWPRCCGFRFYFWEGHREEQLFLESWAAGLWLQFFLLPSAGTSLLRREHSSCHHPPQCLSCCGCCSIKLVPLAAGVTCFAWCCLRPWIGGFSCKISPNLKQRLGSSAALPFLSTQGKAMRGQTLPPLSLGYRAWNKIRVGFWRFKMSSQCVCSAGVPGGAQSPHRALHSHLQIFTFSHL